MENRKIRSKEQQIVSQSSLKFVSEWGFARGYNLDIKDLVLVSRVIEEYVEMGYDKSIGERLEKIDEYLQGKNQQVISKDK